MIAMMRAGNPDETRFYDVARTIGLRYTNIAID
jgi:hypothetical protein